MRFAILFALCFGCATEPFDGPLPVRLADGDLVGTYEDGVLRLEERFAGSFDMPLSIATGSTELALDAERSAVLAKPLAIGDSVELVLAVASEVDDVMPLVVDEPASFLEIGVELSSCQWQYSTTRSAGACDTCAAGEQRVTLEYRKRWTCACAGCWERYGGATWCEAATD